MSDGDAEDRDLELAQVIEGMEVPAPSQAYFEVLRARIKKALRSEQAEELALSGLSAAGSRAAEVASQHPSDLEQAHEVSGAAFAAAQHLGDDADLRPPPVSSDPSRARLGRDQETQGPRTPGAPVGGEPLLEARGVVKTFGRVQALRGASFSVYPGEVVALIGDNGAGKSALLKCLSGVYQPDAGEILMNGQPVRLESPLAAMRRGIETVYQDLALADDLEASANLFLGRERLKPGLLRRLGVLDRKKMRETAAAAFEDLGVALQDVRVPIVSLSGGQRQAVAVARSVVWASSVVLLDEPTAALGVLQRRHVHEVIRRVAERGISVVYVSHNMPEVLEVADRIEVLRLGVRVATFQARDATLEQLVGAMTGALTQEDVA
jgi:simple sugar transport system ATP-binding protein